MLTSERLDVIKKYRKICSEIIKDKLYLGGCYIASDDEILREYGITHIINVSGETCMNMFGDRIEYKTYFVQDSPQESIEGILYDSIEWIEEKLGQNDGVNNNKILVHCQEGVSRSSSIIIGYLMWKERKTFNVVSDYVRSCRSTSSPNIGFTYQLLLFQKVLNINKEGTKLNKSKEENKSCVKSGGSNNSVLFLEREHVIYSTKLYFILNGIPACLINWKNDGTQHFWPDSDKVYILRQTLVDKEHEHQKEKIWIWIGRQVKPEILRECIIGALRFCRQILFIEMGVKSSIELGNLDIRVDLILGALKNERNMNIENVTNVNSSLMILEYFMEYNESSDFINIVFPNSLDNSNNRDITTGLAMQRSFSSPSIKSMSKSVIDPDFDENELIDEEKDSKLDSLVTVDSSFSFSSLPSSPTSSSLISSCFDQVVYPLHDSSDTEFEKEHCIDYKIDDEQRVGFDSKTYPFSDSSERLNSTCANYNTISGKSGPIFDNHTKFVDVGVHSAGKVFIPKLNISNNKLLSSSFTNEDNGNCSLLNKTPPEAYTNKSTEFCPLLSKDKSIQSGELSSNTVMLYRYPDYFSEKNESLKYFDSDDLLPESVCPMVVSLKKDHTEFNGKRLPLSSELVSERQHNEFVVYLWLGSNTHFFNQAKEIIRDNSTACKDLKSFVLDYYSNKSGGNDKFFGVFDLILLFINNISFISLENIKSIYFEFENQESSEFWDLFYQS